MVDLRFRLKVFIAFLFIIIVFGTLGFRFLEGLSVVDAFYFSVVTIATVGYGDIHPSTEPGKFLAMILILCGVGTFLGVVANATEIIVYQREKENRLKKTNVMLGAFFSEIGLHLLTIFTAFDSQIEIVNQSLEISGDWSKKDFSAARRTLKSYQFAVDIHKGNLESLHRFLDRTGDRLLRLLENPVLVEHESFTNLLQAIIHLRDELYYRSDLRKLPSTDYKHLAGDIKRAYRQLVFHWIDYMYYLKHNYPYLYNLAVRTNPFDPKASPVVS